MPFIYSFAALALIALYVIATYNTLVRLSTLVEEAFATMDVFLRKRYDLIPNLVETVKGYASHEKETFENVIAKRNMALGSANIMDKQANEQALNSALSGLFALVENYPDLKANQNFMSLQTELSNVELDIAQARKYYNAVVKDYNMKIQVFPASLVASIFRFLKKDYFEVEGEVRENVKVSF